MNQESRSLAIKTSFFIVIYSVVVLIYAKFPLVGYGDSYDYIYYYATNHAPQTRPVFYSIVVFAVSHFFSIYWVPIFQALLVSLSSFYMLEKIISARLAAIITVVSYVFSAQPILAVSILPDVFVSPLLFLLVIGAYEKSWSNTKTIAFMILVLAILLLHNTYSTLVMLLGFSLFTLRLLFRDFPIKFKYVVWLLSVSAVSMLILSVSNYCHFNQFRPALNSDVAIFSKLVEMGAVANFLDQNNVPEAKAFSMIKDHILSANYLSIFWGERGNNIAKLLSDNLAATMLDQNHLLKSNLKRLNSAVLKNEYGFILKSVPTYLYRQFESSAIFLGAYFHAYPNDYPNQKRVNADFGVAAQYSRQQTGDMELFVGAYSRATFIVMCVTFVFALLSVVFLRKNRHNILFVSVVLLYIFIFIAIYSLLSASDPRYASSIQMAVTSLSLVVLIKSYTKIKEIES